MQWPGDSYDAEVDSMVVWLGSNRRLELCKRDCAAAGWLHVLSGELRL
jgi:hypothetical protein